MDNYEKKQKVSNDGSIKMLKQAYNLCWHNSVLLSMWNKTFTNLSPVIVLFALNLFVPTCFVMGKNDSMSPSEFIKYYKKSTDRFYFSRDELFFEYISDENNNSRFELYFHDNEFLYRRKNVTHIADCIASSERDFLVWHDNEQIDKTNIQGLNAKPHKLDYPDNAYRLAAGTPCNLLLGSFFMNSLTLDNLSIRISEMLEAVSDNANVEHFTDNDGEMFVFSGSNDLYSLKMGLLFKEGYGYIPMSLEYTSHDPRIKVGETRYEHIKCSSPTLLNGLILPGKITTKNYSVPGETKNLNGTDVKYADKEWNASFTLCTEQNNESIHVNSKIFNELIKRIPNDTKIGMTGALHLQYIWLDGKIVPKTDERMLEIAQGGHKFMPSPKESRFWLILLGVIGILIGGGWKLYDFWTSDRKPTSPNPKDQAA